MKSSVPSRSPRILACLLAVGCLLFASCNEFKKMMPKAPATRKVTQADKDPELQKMLGSDKDSEKDSEKDSDKDADPAPEAPLVTSAADHVTGEDFQGASHDLAPDELAGGHTLAKHVGRTDNDLRQRLAQEHISASSTYTDRMAAQFAVGNALEQNSTRIEQWMARSNQPNLVLDYHGVQPVGRTLHRGDTSSRPCPDAKIVLRWLSSSDFYVLTSYPECR